MVFTTAMETRNGFYYIYVHEEWFSLLLWRQGMVFTTGMETMNPFHYCYGVVNTTPLEPRNRFHYCYGDNESFSLLVWRIIMRNKYYILCFSDYIRHLWNYNGE